MKKDSKRNLLLNQPIRDGREGLWADHTHICAECGHEFVCLEYTEKECRTKGVFNAVQVNKSGPFCMLCLHLEMARRFAQARNLKLTFKLKAL